MSTRAGVRRGRGALASAALCALAGCGSNSPSENARTGYFQAHSSSLALTADGARLYVVNPEADSISEIDVHERALVREISLSGSPPTVDADSGNFTPAIFPRALVLSADAKTLYVSGERSGRVHAVDLASGTVSASATLCSEPVGLVRSVDGGSLFVACSQDNLVLRVDPASLAVSGTVPVANEPWALAWSGDGATLLVSHLLGPGITPVDPEALSAGQPWAVPDTAPRGDQRLAHGQARGLYDLVARPGSGELWTAHTLLGTDTAQPELDFESTAFPAISVLSADGSFQQTLSTDAQDVPGVDGSFADVVSGPHALELTPEGDYALLVDANSEDVLVVDAERRVERSLVRPLPGKLPDGIVISPDGKFAYVDERGSLDIAVLALDRSSGALTASVVDQPIPRVAVDPLPATLRLGQALFNSANSSEYPITTDHWIACATCHMEGRSDAVTWLFAQGPRDTPSNAGGVLGTGFLFRTADRNQIQDYFHTINVEQGGHFDATLQAPLLDALSEYVNHALPSPIPPTTDPDLVTRGAAVFTTSGCDSCHDGSRFTDSGAGNPTLDFAGPVLLHDVGTCVSSGAFPDVPHEAVNGDARTACDFDTPSLNGIASSPPYLHDGSAPTLRDAILKMPGAPTSDDDVAALVEYLRSL